MSNTQETNPIIFVVGATGSGKSGAAMMAATETPGSEIVAADRYTAWDEGLPQEVEQLVAKYGWVEPLRRAIGYKEFMPEDGRDIGDHD